LPRVYKLSVDVLEIGPLEHYLGFGRRDVYEKWEGEWAFEFYIGRGHGLEMLDEKS
jgi:hypothetical protein